MGSGRGGTSSQFPLRCGLKAVWRQPGTTTYPRLHGAHENSLQSCGCSSSSGRHDSQHNSVACGSSRMRGRRVEGPRCGTNGEHSSLFTWHPSEANDGHSQPTDSGCGPTFGVGRPANGDWSGRLLQPNRSCKVLSTKKSPWIRVWLWASASGMYVDIRCLIKACPLHWLRGHPITRSQQVKRCMP